MSWPKVLSFFLLTSLLATYSCKKTDPPPSLTIDTNTLNETAAAGKDSVQISSNTSWTITGQPNWLTVTPSSGSGNTKVYLSFPANLSLNALQATLTVNGNHVSGSQTVTINQAGAAPIIMVDKNPLTENPLGQADSVVVTSNVPWSLSIPTTATWITADHTSGPAGATKVHFSVAANTTGAPHSATLTFASTGATANSVSVTVSQAQPDVVITSFDNHAPGGATITINGTGFVPTASQNIVKINGVQATVTAATATALSVTVPSKAGSGNISVAVGAKSATSTGTFTYDWIYNVSTLAGTGAPGSTDGSLSVATFNGPIGVAVGANNWIYVADYLNHRIRVIGATSTGTLAGSIAGFVDGSGSSAQFHNPYSVAFDAAGNAYIADFINFAIRKVSTTGAVSTLAGGTQGNVDGTGSSAKFGGPTGVAVDAAGNIFVTDYNNNSIRKVTPSGVVTTFAGGSPGSADGTGASAQFNGPTRIVIDASGNLFVTDRGNNRIRKITAAGVVTTVAGSTAGSADGIGNNAQFRAPNGLTVDVNGNIYVADMANNSIRKISTSGQVTTIAGGAPGYLNAVGTNARFNSPNDITIDASGNLYVADYNNNVIRKITPQ